MFKYLLIKSIIDFCFSILQLMKSLNVCQSFRTLLCFVVQIWFFEYFQYIFLSLSIVFEIAATFDCYININKKLECRQTSLFFYLFSFCAFVVYFLVYLTYPFSFKLKKITETDPLNNSTIADVLILISLIEATKLRRNVARNNNILMISSQKAERKKILMILTTGINYMIGHLPNFIVPFLLYNFRIYLNCLDVYIDLLFYLSYVDGIIFYFLYNNIFRRILISTLIKRN
jgi:hypothetical protein